MFRFPCPCYRVTVDGARYEAASVIVANGHYYGGRFICAPRACLDDDTFEVCLFLSTGPFAVLRYGLALVRGRLERLADFRIVRGAEVAIEILGESSGESSGDHQGIEPVQVDGDIGAQLPLTVQPTSRSLVLVYGGQGH